MSAFRTEIPSRIAQECDELATNIERVIIGKREPIELAITCLFAQGHLLLEDVPGVGKTTLAKALARSVGGTFGRIQFTPDLLPSDVFGVNVWDRSTGAFSFRPGPVFANVVVADEVNRAAPKTQSALLEAMAERQVTVDGTTHLLEEPFLVLATQNPVEHQGTYPLPESELDRFCMRLSLGYPNRADEIDLLDENFAYDRLAALSPVLDPARLAEIRAEIHEVGIAASLRRYLVDIARATREHPLLELGMSPRATLTLQLVARAFAAVHGRDYVIPDDVRDVLIPVVAHRLTVTAEGRLQGMTAARVLTEITERLAVPTGARDV